MFDLTLAINTSAPTNFVFYPYIDIDLINEDKEISFRLTCKYIYNKCFAGKLPKNTETTIQNMEYFVFENLQYQGSELKTENIYKLFGELVQSNTPEGKREFFQNDKACDYTKDDWDCYELDDFAWDEEKEDVDHIYPHFIKKLTLYYCTGSYNKDYGYLRFPTYSREHVEYTFSLQGHVGSSGETLRITNEPLIYSHRTSTDFIFISKTSKRYNEKFEFPLMIGIYPNQPDYGVKNLCLIEKKSEATLLDKWNERVADELIQNERIERKKHEPLYSRKKADEAVKQLLKRIDEHNKSNPRYLVKELVIFGSYTNSEKTKIGDVDVAVSYETNTDIPFPDTDIWGYETYADFWKMIKGGSRIIEPHSMEDYIKVCKTYNISEEEKKLHLKYVFNLPQSTQ